MECLLIITNTSCSDNAQIYSKFGHTRSELHATLSSVSTFTMVLCFRYRASGSGGEGAYSQTYCCIGILGIGAFILFQLSF